MLPLNLERNYACSICLESICDNEISVLPCKHIFHKSCLDLINNNRCPLCRSTFQRNIERNVERYVDQIEHDSAEEDFHDNIYDDNEDFPDIVEGEELPISDDEIDLYDAYNRYIRNYDEYTNNARIYDDEDDVESID